MLRGKGADVSHLRQVPSAFPYKALYYNMDPKFLFMVMDYFLLLYWLSVWVQ